MDAPSLCDVFEDMHSVVDEKWETGRKSWGWIPQIKQKEDFDCIVSNELIVSFAPPHFHNDLKLFILHFIS